MMRRLVVGAVCLILIVAAFPVLAQETEMAHLRLGHFSPGFGDVDVYIDGGLSDDLSFGELAEWVEFAPATYSIAVTAIGASIDDAIVTGELTLAADDWVTEIVIGQEPRGTVALHSIVEDYSTLGFEETRVTFLNTVPDMDAVNVQLDDGTVLVERLLYPELDSTDENAADGYMMMDLLAGNRTIQITPFGDSATTLVSLDNALFASGKSNFVVLAGLQDNLILTWAATAIDDGTETVTEDVNVGDGTAFVRVGDFLSGVTEEVDCYIDGELRYVGLTLGDVTDWFELPAGFYDLAVAPTGTSLDDAIVVTEDVPVVTNQHTLLAAIGSVELDAGMFYPVVENYSDLTYGETRLAFFHAVQDLEPANVQLADGTVLMMTIGYPGLPGVISYDSTDIVAGPRDVQVVSSVDPTVVLSDLPATQLSADSNNLIVIAGLRDAPVTFHLVTAQD